VGTPEPLPTLAPAPAGAIRFQVAPDRSTATFRVREQLAGISFPSDAVGCTGTVSGQLVVQPSGEFVAGASRVAVDLRDLKSNSDQRDNFIKMAVMQTSRYPMATFVPTRAQGLPNPLPASGSATFTLAGQMTVHGVTKEQTWDVQAMRSGNQLSGTATTSFKFGDFGMTPPRVPVVLSVVDEIRLEVKLAATVAG
jgi:polyisoprenoid-binding protein YceI